MRFYELFEYNRKDFAKKHKKVLTEVFPDTDPEEILKEIEKGDPTGQKQFIMWIVIQLNDGAISLKDMNQTRELLMSYKDVKPRLPPRQKDIYKFNFQELSEIINEILSLDTNVNTDLNLDNVNSNEYRVLYNKPLGLLVIPETENAACVLGGGTKWCTAATISLNMFEFYTRCGPMYFWIDKTGKYAFQFETIEFKDNQDIAIDWDVIEDWRNNHPVLSSLFKEGEKRLGTTNLDDTVISNIFQYNQKVMNTRLSEKLEVTFFRHANIQDIITYVSSYPKSTDHAEKNIIIQYSNKSMYMPEIITYNKKIRENKRWPVFEELILGTHKYTTEHTYYIQHVIKGKWVEYENLILGFVENAIRNDQVPNIEQTANYSKDILGIKLSQWKEFMNILNKYNYELPKDYS